MDIDNIEKVIKYGLIIIDLSESNVLSWEEKYDAVFHTYKKIRELGFNVDYCDEDRGYKDDVLALCIGIEKHMMVWQEIAKIIEVNNGK